MSDLPPVNKITPADPVPVEIPSLTAEHVPVPTPPHREKNYKKIILFGALITIGLVITVIFLYRNPKPYVASNIAVSDSQTHATTTQAADLQDIPVGIIMDKNPIGLTHTTDKYQNSVVGEKAHYQSPDSPGQVLQKYREYLLHEGWALQQSTTSDASTFSVARANKETLFVHAVLSMTPNMTEVYIEYKNTNPLNFK